VLAKQSERGRRSKASLAPKVGAEAAPSDKNGKISSAYAALNEPRRKSLFLKKF